MVVVIGVNHNSPDLIDVRTPVCMHCQQDSLMSLPAEALSNYFQGAFVQDAFPQLSIDQRELIVSGTHPECWFEMFGSDD